MEPRRTTPNQSPGGARLRRDFFVYAINFATLAPGGAPQSAIQIQADSDFELQKLTCYADIAGAAQTESTRTLPNVTIQITDTGTGRQMFNIPVAIPALFGDGRIPFILPTTKIFSMNASVAITVVSFEAAVTWANLRINLIGSKIFAYG